MTVTNTLARHVALINKAGTAEDLFGPNDLGRRKRELALAQQLHPDKWHDHADKVAATHAFQRVQELLAIEKSAGADRFMVAAPLRTYVVKGLAHRGTVSNLYRCTYVRDDAAKTGLLKLPRSPKDNDLMAAEAKTLKAIQATDSRRRAFFPRIEETFKHRDRTTRVDRRAIVVRSLAGFTSLVDVKASYSGGIDSRDLAWMWRRGLAALSLLHEQGLVHGAVVPEHFLIHPREHGVILCGLGASVETGQTIKILGGPTRYYPPEVLDKKPATTATDIYMLTTTMRSMLTTDAPRQFYAFARGCMFDRPAVRPQDPRVLLHEFDELLERLYGPRTFRPFHLPERSQP